MNIYGRLLVMSVIMFYFPDSYHDIYRLYSLLSELNNFAYTICVLIRLLAKCLKNANALLYYHCQVRFEPTGWILGAGGLKGDWVTAGRWCWIPT